MLRLEKPLNVFSNEKPLSVFVSNEVFVQFGEAVKNNLNILTKTELILELVMKS
jgi:hypothetical protein